MSSFNQYSDVIDVRDIIARIEELRETREEYDEKMSEPGAWAKIDDGEPDELAALESLMEELATVGGGDEQWEGVWYPGTLIRDSHFEEYAQELADDIGAINRDAGWPNNCIDWERAARELQKDYTSVDFDGVTYWTR